MTPELTNEHQLFRRTGSFWTSIVPEPTRAIARALCRLNHAETIGSDQRRLISRLTDNAAVAGRRRIVHVAVADVVYVPGTPAAHWTVALDPDAVPLALATKLGLRVIGTDYSYDPATGVLTLPESPYKLFELPRIEIASYREAPASLLAYPLQLDGPCQHIDEVARYYRVSQDPGQFRRAIAAAAGYAVLPFTSVLRAKTGSTYVFDDGVIEAAYDHPELTVGETYEQGTVVGDMVRVTAGSTPGLDWYRTLDWASGLPLDDVSPFRGLTAPDEQRRVYTTGESTTHAGKYHVQAQLDILEPSGAALVVAGVTEIEVKFARRLNTVPRVFGAVRVADTGTVGVQWFTVTAINESGFKVFFLGASPSDFYFDWYTRLPAATNGQADVAIGTDRVSFTFTPPANGVPVLIGCVEALAGSAVEVFGFTVRSLVGGACEVIFSGATTLGFKFTWEIVPMSVAAGQVFFPTGVSKVTVPFPRNLSFQPSVATTLRSTDIDNIELFAQAVNQVSQSSFDLILQTPPSKPMWVHWVATENYGLNHDRFWAHQAQMADRTGFFLADALGLTAPGEVSANLLEVFFQYLLGLRGLVVDLRLTADNTTHVARAQRFVRREKPIGAALVLRTFS